MVEINDPDLTPRFERGDIVSGPKHAADKADNLIGLDCIIQLEDGQSCIGVLMRGRKQSTYDVRFFDRSRADLRDVRVEWAAPIRMILRGN